MASLPGIYLGLPLTVKDVSNSFWVTILERMQRKLAGWKGRLLASTLQGIPIYFLSLYKIPAAMVGKLENIQRTLFWTGMEEKKRLSLVGWDKFCYPKWMGFLGICKITHFNKALMSKTT